jgi:hypothetical protein
VTALSPPTPVAPARPASSRRYDARLSGRARDRLAVFVLLLVGLGVGLVATRLTIADPFLLFRLARVEAWLSSGAFIPYGLNVGVFDEQRPLFEMILASLAIGTGLTPLQIAILPVGAVILPIAAYGLCQRLLRDRLLAVLLAMALVLNHAFATVHLGTFVYVWSTLLLLAFLGVLANMLSTGKSPIAVVALAALYFVTEALYQTTATWMILVLLAVSILAWIDRRRGIRTTVVVASGALALACMAYFLYFDRSFQTAFLASLARHGTGSQLSNAIDGLLAQLNVAFWAGPRAVMPYEASAPPNAVAAGAIITQWALFGLAGVVGLAALARSKFRPPLSGLRGRWVFLIAVVVAAVGHTAVYALYGHFSPRVISLLGGVLGAVFLASAGLPSRAIRLWAVALVIASLSGSVAFFAASPPADSSAATEAAARWLLAQAPKPAVTADLGLYGRLLLTASAENRVIELVDLDSCAFSHIVEAAPTCSPGPVARFVVFSRRDLKQPMQSIAWKAFGPPARYWQAISANPAQRLVYDNDGIVIFERLIGGS